MTKGKIFGKFLVWALLLIAASYGKDALEYVGINDVFGKESRKGKTAFVQADLPNPYNASYAIATTRGGVEYKLGKEDKIRLESMVARFQGTYGLSNNAITTLLSLADSNNNQILETGEISQLEKRLYDW